MAGECSSEGDTCTFHGTTNDPMSGMPMEVKAVNHFHGSDKEIGEFYIVLPDRSEWRIAREVYVAETSERARREALAGVLRRDFEQYFLRLVPRMRAMDLFKIDPDMPDSEVTPEYLVDNIWVVGSPEEVAAKLRRIYHDTGGFGVLLSMGHEWEPRD